MMPLYKVLGYCGVIPFFVFTLGLYFFDAAIGKYFMAMQMFYASLIASFLAGIHWAHSFPAHREGQMLCAMIPTILSLLMLGAGLVILFGGLLMMIPSKILLSAFFLIYALMFITIYIFDWQWLDQTKLPEDYILFRLQITIIVSGLLFLSFGGIWLH
ncbi:MAG: DUF3429 domain-containing protein [Alphaproteobacteria bacterium]